MLKIFNNLEPFFEDVFRAISVREYARMVNISPPTASKVLNNFLKENILFREKNKIYLNFTANNQNFLFRGLAVLLWKQKLGLELKKIHNRFLYKEIILFGSIAKGENTLKSDVDLFIDIPKKIMDLSELETKLKRKIQIHFANSKENKLLFNNIKRGIKIL